MISYGMKRWVLGQLYGGAFVAAWWAYSVDGPWTALAGFACLAYFADYLIEAPIR